MQKQKLILIIGITLALIAVAMVWVYIEQQRQAIQEQAKKALVNIQANQTAVLVAKKDLPPGTAIEPEMLESVVVPNQYLQPQAATSLDRVSGMITVALISKGEQIGLNKLSYSARGLGSGGGLAQATPVGKRAVTISVDNISSVAGMVKPGDYVDVIALLPVPVQTHEGKQSSQAAIFPLFQNVLVLAVGQETEAYAAQAGRYKKEEQKESSPLITLALNPQETNLIAFVQEQGKIKLALRSPADSKIEPVQPASWEVLFKYLMPQETPQQQTEEEVELPSGYVEVYKGLHKEKVPISK